MLKQSKIIKGRDNPVIIIFKKIDLTLFTKIEATFGSDTKDSLSDPSEVKVVIDPELELEFCTTTELQLRFGTTSETTENFWLITGFDAVNVNGVDLTSECLGNLQPGGICN